MGSPGLRSQTDHREAGHFFLNRKFCHTRLTGGVDDALGINRAATGHADRLVNRTGNLRKFAPANGPVFFLNFAPEHLLPKILTSTFVLGDNHNATGFAVEPVDEARSFDTVFPEQLRQRSLVRSRSRMTNQAPRFVHHKYIVIFEENNQWM